MERFYPLLLIIAWFGSIFAASYCINWLLIRSIVRQVYRYFVAPGVIVHEFSHALGCLATGAHIIEINFWKSTGGHVKHYQPKVPIIGEAIIALAPIGGSFLALAVATYFLVPDLVKLSYFIDVSVPGTLISALNLASWQTWLYLYLVTSLLATMAPSKTDMHYALASLVTLSVLLVILSFIPGFPDVLYQTLQVAQPFATFSIVLMLLALLFAVLLALPYANKHFVAKEQID